MSNSRQRITGIAAPPGRPGMMRASVLRRSPFLLLAALALLALAVFFVHDSPPAQADHGTATHLTGLGITGTTTRGGETFTFGLSLNQSFDPNTASYTIRVPNDLRSISFTPTWTHNSIRSVVLYERGNSNSSIQGAEVIGNVITSGSTLTNSSNPRFPALQVPDLDFNNDNMKHFFRLELVSAPSFGGGGVDDMVFTAGAEALKSDLGADEVEALRLPEATGGFDEVTYTATGLPAGLSLSPDRLVIGTPEARTDTPATVTYTATDSAGGTASLTFQVTVLPPPASVYFQHNVQLAREIDYHGLRHTGVYAVAIDPPLESDSSVHLRIKPSPYPDEESAAEGEDYTMDLPDAPGTSMTKVLELPAGESRAYFTMWFEPDLETEDIESLVLELAAIEDAPYTVVDDFQSDKYPNVNIAIEDTSRAIPADADPHRGVDIQPKSVKVGATSFVSYTVALASMPQSDVTVKAYLEGPDGEALNIGFAGSTLEVSPVSLTFSSSNWSTPQTFTVSPKDPALSFDDVILHGLESDDLDYHTFDSFQGPGIGETYIEIEVLTGGL